MRAVVLFASLVGRTEALAERIGGALEAAGVDVSVYPIADFDFRALADADVVFLGTWTDGFVFFAQRPGGARRIWKLPELTQTPVALFCTYTTKPGKVLAKLARIMATKGSKVVTTMSFNRRRVHLGVPEFVKATLDAVPRPPPDHVPPAIAAADSE
ncbi:MAG: flavodoxin family protein [Acidimicrobiia bacterium]